MTTSPALKAMVEAMRAEMERQMAATDVKDAFGRSVGMDATNVTIEGIWEKVARAGLAAINRPSLGSLAAAWRLLGSEEECGVPVRDLYETMIDEILKETP